MAKRFCKLNRRDITEHLGEIHSLVTEPKFVCRGCARSSANGDNLCKPSAIPPAHCQTKSDVEKAACGLLAETLPKVEPTISLEPVAQEKAVKAKDNKVEKNSAKKDVMDEKSLKKAKKVLKQQKSQAKKLAKVVKKQTKLLKKHQSLEKQFTLLNQSMSDIDQTMVSIQQVH